MAITELFSGSASIGTTEYSLTNNSTTLAAQATSAVVWCVLDLNALAAGDLYEIRIYEKCRSSSTQRIAYEAFIEGPVSNPEWISPSLGLMHGWEITLDKISGTDRTIEWSIRAVT